MKVYQVGYDNGWDYEDHEHWVSDKVHLNKEGAIQELEGSGYERKPIINKEIHWGSDGIQEVEVELYLEIEPGVIAGFATINELLVIEGDD